MRLNSLLAPLPFNDTAPRRFRACHMIVFLFVLPPILSLALNALAWLSYGIDLPYADDWRTYRDGTAYSLDPRVLFTPANDTLFAVGKTLDAVAMRYLAGNSVAYQFLSMVVVLGSLLYLQWRLLVRVLEDRVLAAASFTFTVFMLQPDSYWGMQNLAYHQALPLVCVLTTLLVITNTSTNIYIFAGQLLVVGFVSGLTYISGAFAVLTLAVILFLFARSLSSENVQLERRSCDVGAAVLFVPGVSCTFAQLWVILSVQKGEISAKVPWAMPYEADFWAYMMGKFGRALLLPPNSPKTSLAVTAFVLLISVVITAVFALRLICGRLRTSQETRAAVVFISLHLIVFVYMALVAAGRAKLRPQTDQAFVDVFAFGFLRFHFFWATILWPWVVAALLLWTKSWASDRFALAAAFFLPVLSLPLAAYLGAYNHAADYREKMKFRVSNEVSCIQAAIQRGSPIICPGTGWDGDLSSVVQFARVHGASFTRYFADLRPVAMPLLPLADGPAMVEPIAAGEILPGTSITQRIYLNPEERRVLRSGGIVCLRLMLATYARKKLEGHARIILNVGDIVENFELPFSLVKDSKYHELCSMAHRLEGYSNEYDTIRIEGIDGSSGQVVTALLSKDTSRGVAAVDGKGTDRSLVFTITKSRFEYAAGAYLLWFMALAGLLFRLPKAIRASLARVIDVRPSRDSQRIGRAT
jgi:hypothetical protein